MKPQFSFINTFCFFILTGAIGIFSFCSCSATSGRSFLPSIPGYHENQKRIIVLDDDLLEISGMYYLQDDQVASINDEDGKIFIIDTKNGSFKQLKYGKKRDYEDIVKVDSFFYILESNGNVHKVSLSGGEGDEEFEFKEEKKIEFESMYFDGDSKKLILISKEQREIKDAILAYSFDIATKTFSTDPYYSIPMKSIYYHVKDINAVCKPSAAAVHPILHKVFIIASIGKMLLVCSMKGEVEHVFQLNPVHFPQPEGITFATNGDMFISNEGVQGKATILKFPYSKP